MKLKQLMKRHKTLIRISSALLVTGGVCGFVIPILQTNRPKPKTNAEIIPTFQAADFPKTLPSPTNHVIDLGTLNNTGSPSFTAIVASNKDDPETNLTQPQLNKGMVDTQKGLNSKFYSNKDNKETTIFEQEYGQKGYGSWLTAWYESLFGQQMNEDTKFSDTISNSFTHYNDRYGVKTNRNANVVKIHNVDYFQDIVPLYNQGAVKSLNTAAYGDSQINWKNGYIEENGNRSNLIALSNQPLVTDNRNVIPVHKWNWDYQYGLKPQGLNSPNNFYQGQNLETTNFLDNFHNRNAPIKNFTKGATFKIVNNNHSWKRAGTFNSNHPTGWFGGISEAEEWNTLFSRWVLGEGSNLIDNSTYQFSHNILDSHIKKTAVDHRIELQPNHHNPWNGFGRWKVGGDGYGYLYDWIYWNDYMGANSKALTLPQIFLQRFYDSNYQQDDKKPLLIWTNNNIKSIRTVDVDFSNLLKMILSNTATIEDEISSDKSDISGWKTFIDENTIDLKKKNISLIKTNIVENLFIQNHANNQDLVDFAQQNLHTQNLLAAGNNVSYHPWNDFLKFKKNGYTGNNWVVSFWKENASKFSIGLISPKLASLDNNSLMLEMNGISFKNSFEWLSYGFFSSFQALTDRPRWWFNTVLQNWITNANTITNPLIVLNNLLENFVWINDYTVVVNDIEIKIDKEPQLQHIKTLAFFIFNKGKENLNLNGNNFYNIFKPFETDIHLINNPNAQTLATQILSNFYDVIKDTTINTNESSEIPVEVITGINNSIPTPQSLYIPSAGIEDNQQFSSPQDLSITDLILDQIDVSAIQTQILTKFNTTLKQPNHPNFNIGDVSYDFMERGKIDFTTEPNGLKKVLFPSKVTSHYFNKNLFIKSAGSLNPSFSIEIDNKGQYIGPENIDGAGKSETFNMFVRAQSETHVTNDRNIVFNLDDISSSSNKEWAKRFSVDDLKSAIIEDSDQMGYYNLTTNSPFELIKDSSKQYYKLQLDQIKQSQTHPQLYDVLMDTFDKINLSNVLNVTNFTDESGNSIPVDKKLTLKEAIETSYKTPWNNKLIKDSLIIDLQTSLFERDTGNVFLKIMINDFKTDVPEYSGELTTAPPPFADIIAANPDAQRDFDNGTFLYSQSFSNSQDNFVIHFNQIFKLADSYFTFDKRIWNELSVTNQGNEIKSIRNFRNRIATDFRSLIINSGNSTTSIESFDDMETLTSPVAVNESITNGRRGIQVKLKFTFRNWRNSDGTVDTLKKVTFNSALNLNVPENNELPFLDSQGNNIQWQGLSFENINYNISDSIPGVSFGTAFIDWLKDGFTDTTNVAYTNLINFFEQKQEFDAASIWDTQMQNKHYIGQTFGQFVNANVSFLGGTGFDVIRQIELSSGFKILPTDSGFSLIKPFVQYNVYANGKIQALGQSVENITFRSWKQTNTTIAFLKNENTLLQSIQDNLTTIIKPSWRVDELTFQENFGNLSVEGRKLFLRDILNKNAIIPTLGLNPNISQEERDKAYEVKVVEITNNIDKITINPQTNGGLKVDVALLNVPKFDTSFISLRSGTNKNENFFIAKSHQNFNFEIQEGVGFIANIDNLRKDSKLSLEWNLLLDGATTVENKTASIQKILKYWKSNQFEVFKDLVSLNGLRIVSIDSITKFKWDNMPGNFNLVLQNNKVYIGVNHIAFENLGSKYTLVRDVNEMILIQYNKTVDNTVQDITISNWWVYLIVGGVGVIMLLLVLLTYFMLKKQRDNKIEIIKNDGEDKWMKD